MTEPMPTPGAPEPTPSTEPATQPPAPQPAEDIASLPDWAQKIIKDTRSEAAKYRQRGQSAADEARTKAASEITATIAKALGISGEDEPVDPQELANQIQAAQNAQFRAAADLQLYRAGARLGVDIDAAMDSKSFEDAFLGELEQHEEEILGLEPGSSQFNGFIEQALNAALDKHPKFRTTTSAGQAPAAPPSPRPDPSQGSRAGAPTHRTADLAGAVAKYYNASR